jgi:carbamoyltransferase
MRIGSDAGYHWRPLGRAPAALTTEPPTTEVNAMRVLGVNAVFHDPAAALVVDGEIIAATEEERFSRRKHGKAPVPFSTWELPEQSMRWCLQAGGLTPSDLDAVAYSYDPVLTPDADGDVAANDWEGLRTLYARRAPRFLRTALPGLDPRVVRFVPHHVAHAASAHLAAPFRDSAVLVLDGRGETASHLAGHATNQHLEVLAAQQLPHSLGLLYEEVTAHLGFRRSSDEYKVMAMASYGTPRWLPRLRELVRATDDGGFVVEPVDWAAFVPRLWRGDGWTPAHADLAASVQSRLEEVLLDLAVWVHGRTGERSLTMAGGVALNCVANARLAAEGPFERIWVQPAAGDAGTALGGALHVAASEGDRVQGMSTAALGRSWTDQELAAWLVAADVSYERPDDIADAVAEVIAANGVVAWFQGRSEYGPRALGHRSLLANATRAENVTRLNDVKGREQFRPVAPMVLADRAWEIFDGQLPSPYMLFAHRVQPGWAERIPAVVHIDGTARIQTVDAADEPLVARMLRRVECRTGVPVVVNTSLNSAGRPMVDSPRDALECFGSAPVDALALGPYLVRRHSFMARSAVGAARQPLTTEAFA